MTTYGNPKTVDQFYYSRRLISRIIENYYRFQEIAMKDPGNDIAVMLYDVTCAIQLAGLSRKQTQTLMLQAQGLTPLDIAYDLRLNYYLVRKRALLAYRRLAKILNRWDQKNERGEEENGKIGVSAVA